MYQMVLYKYLCSFKKCIVCVHVFMCVHPIIYDACCYGNRRDIGHCSAASHGQRVTYMMMIRRRKSLRGKVMCVFVMLWVCVHIRTI